MADFPPNLSIRPLTIEDLPQCVALENSRYPLDARCSKEQFQYRLTVCPELCSGLFVRKYGHKYNAVNLPEVVDQLEKDMNYEEGDATKSGKDGEPDCVDVPTKLSVVKETLIGHTIATKSYTERITVSSMALPLKDDPTRGHVEQSRYIGVHSLVVDNKWRGKKLGTLLMHDYIQKLSNQDLGSKVVIIAKEELVSFYEKIGFVNHGQSECQHGDTTWYDMSIDLVPQEDE